ncbi:MAG: oligosaccharide flippase family protein [Proteobacteria bacterium]|nr:oligosaccharide flippase family protein [Pseudomonadota bacterium]
MQRGFNLTATLGSRLRSGLTGLALLRGIALVLSTLSSIIVARAIGPSDYGQLAFVLALASVLSIPSNGAAVAFLVRFTAAYDRPSTHNLLVGAWQWSAGQARLWATLGCLIALVTALWFGIEKSWADAVPYFLAAALVPMWAGGARVTGILQGLKRVVLAQLFDWLVLPTIYLTLVLGLLLTNLLTMEYVLAAFAAAVGLSIGVGTLTAGKVRAKQVTTPVSPVQDASWQPAWRHYLLIQAVSVANLKFPLILIGFMSVSEEAGLYRAAESIALLLAIMIAIVNSTLGPYVSQLFYEQKLGDLQNIMQRISRFAFIMALPFVVLMLIGGEWLLATIYGDAYCSAYLALAILLIGQLVNVACGSVGLLLNMTGNEAYVFKSLSMAFAISMILCVVLIPAYGAFGASIAATISMMFWNVLQLVRSIRFVRVNPSILSTRPQMTPE